MRALTALGFAVSGGAALGLASRVFTAVPADRPVASVFTVFGLAICLGAAVRADGPERWRAAALAGGAAAAAAWSAATAAGDPSLVASAAVVGAAALAACGVAALVRRYSSAPAAFAGAFAVAAPAAFLFVADPFVGWTGGGEGTLDRAQAVVTVNPLASIAADAGIDWQRRKWMYDGPAPGSTGLSVIGQDYPSRPSSPWTWALAAAALGSAALAAARPRSMLRA